MYVFREGRLLDSKLGTGDILSLELGEGDVKSLLDEKRRYTMIRFMELGERIVNLKGWAMEDKCHVSLEPSDTESLASLTLDAGGDLYFTLFDTPTLEVARWCHVFRSLDEVVDNDPSEVLDRLGIEQVRIYNLPLINIQRQNQLFEATLQKPYR